MNILSFPPKLLDEKNPVARCYRVFGVLSGLSVRSAFYAVRHIGATAYCSPKP